MQMTSDEIRVRYKQAKNKTEQVKILAELNDCDVETIISSICESGEYKTEHFNKIRSIFKGTCKNKPTKKPKSEPQKPQEITVKQAVNRIRYEISLINSEINGLIVRRQKLINEIIGDIDEQELTENS